MFVNDKKKTIQSDTALF